jgi:hypothetical protein
MKLIAGSLVFLLLGAILVSDLHAQQKPILSPRDSVFLSMDTNKISVDYGRPSMRGRVIMGGLVPWGQVWRTGANQATQLKTNFPMVFGGVPVPKGTYTLWTLPSEKGWKVIVNKQTGQWGTDYDPRLDLARFDAKVEALSAPVDTFTIGLKRTGPTAGEMALSWEKTRVVVPFERNNTPGGLSPLDSAQTSLGGKAVVVKFSKPFMRGREIWGVVVPWDSVWRTGANQPTSLKTEAGLMIGNQTIPAGSYVLRSLPTEKSFTLIIMRRGGEAQGPIPDSLVVARVPMQMQKSAQPIDPFKIWFDAGPNAAAMLKLGWADRIYSVAVAIK